MSIITNITNMDNDITMPGASSSSIELIIASYDQFYNIVKTIRNVAQSCISFMKLPIKLTVHVHSCMARILIILKFIHFTPLFYMKVGTV